MTHQIVHAYEVSSIKVGLQDLTGKAHQIEPAYKVAGRGCRISRLGTTDRTCLLGIRRWLQDLTGSKHQIECVYEMSERCCMISRARNTRSYMPTRYQDGAARSHGLANQIVHTYEISGPGCRVSRVHDTISNTPRAYQDGAAGSYGFGPTDSTCLQGIRSVLQDLTGNAHQIDMPSRHVGVAGSHGLGTTDRTCLLGISRWLQDLMGSKHQIERAYEVSERWCIISRARNTRSYMLTRYQDGAAGPHGFGKQDRTCLRGITTGLQDLTGLEQQIQHDYAVSGRGCKILRVQKIR